MIAWEPRPMKAGANLHWGIGPLDIWARRETDEVHVAVGRGRTAVRGEGSWSGNVDDAEPGEGAEWTRWVVGDAPRDIWLCPAMPDRPVVVRPEHPVRLPPKQHATFFVSIPVWVQVTVSNGRVILCEEPTVVLSNIWFQCCPRLARGPRSSLISRTHGPDRECVCRKPPPVAA